MNWKDASLVAASAAILIISSILARPIGAEVIVPLIVGTLLIQSTVLVVFRSLAENHKTTGENITSTLLATERTCETLYKQMESFLTVLFTLRPELPLPLSRGWAAAPDFLKIITELVLKNKTAYVFEVGSGLSTLIVGYCLKRLGSGRMVTLEHNETYYAINKDLVAFHGLEDIVSIIHAPLKETNINGKIWLWYDTDCFSVNAPIDMLIVDGPPGDTQPKARYPILPVLYKHLSDSATIIMDDGNREDEKAIVALWEKEHDVLVSTFLNLERGAYIIEKRKR
jgi:predicted O-methyltransferase YrrM